MGVAFSLGFIRQNIENISFVENISNRVATSPKKFVCKLVPLSSHTTKQKYIDISNNLDNIYYA